MIFLTITSYAEPGENFSPSQLSDQLLDLAEGNNFVVQGIDKTQSFSARGVVGDVESKIKQLLVDFNYMLIRSDQGGIEELIILGAKPQGPKNIVVATHKQGDHHIVASAVKGPSNEWINVQLLVDTGADRIVLPNSMMQPLGYADFELTTRRLQTANGIVEAKISQLEAIELGSEIIENADVAFVEDKLIGGIMLLGMNVLKRYRFTIDNNANQITLIKVTSGSGL